MRFLISFSKIDVTTIKRKKEAIAMELIEVVEKKEIKEVARLADEIWHEHYQRIISNEQIDYMVGKYQSEGAVSRQIKDGYHYFLAQFDGENAGYIGLVFQPEQKKVFLSKIYVLKKYRGKGVAGKMFAKAVELAKGWKAERLWLTVNRENTESVQVYKHWGFEIARVEDTAIGNGFEMNDYIMEYELV